MNCYYIIKYEEADWLIITDSLLLEFSKVNVHCKVKYQEVTGKKPALRLEGGAVGLEKCGVKVIAFTPISRKRVSF